MPGAPVLLGDVVTKDVFNGLPCGGVVIVSGDYHTTDPTPTEFTPSQRAQNLVLVVNISAVSGAGATVTVEVDGWDKGSLSWVPLLTSAGLVAVGASILRIGPNITATANISAQSPLFETMRVKPVGSGTRTTLNYSISANFSA